MVLVIRHKKSLLFLHDQIKFNFSPLILPSGLKTLDLKLSKFGFRMMVWSEMRNISHVWPGVLHLHQGEECWLRMTNVSKNFWRITLQALHNTESQLFFSKEWNTFFNVVRKKNFDKDDLKMTHLSTRDGTETIFHSK